jgi:hypothetical protein
MRGIVIAKDGRRKIKGDNFDQVDPKQVRYEKIGAHWFSICNVATVWSK